MPIINLTDKVDLSQALPLIGRLYKGAEQETKISKRTGKEYKQFGKDLDYFRVVFEPQFEHLQPLWEEMYGKEPTVFHNVFLTAPTVDIAFASWKEEWTATTMLHRCDGEKQVMHYNTQIHKYSTAHEACASTAARPCECTNIGRLNMLLMDFIDESDIFGTFLATTHSINDILTVYRRLAATEAMYGTLSNIPFVFGRADKEIRAPRANDQGEIIGRRNTTKSLFYMHLAEDFTHDKLVPMIKAGNAWFKDGSQPLLTQQGTATNLLNSGSARGERRIGAKTTPAQPIAQVEDIPADVIPVHPDPTPLTRLVDTLKANGITFEAAANVLGVSDAENMEAWKKHGNTPNEIVAKVQAKQAEEKSKTETKSVSGTVVDEDKKPIDSLTAGKAGSSPFSKPANPPSDPEWEAIPGADEKEVQGALI